MNFSLNRIYHEILSEVLDFQNIKTFEPTVSGDRYVFHPEPGINVVVTFEDVSSDMSKIDFAPFLSNKFNQLINVNYTMNDRDDKFKTETLANFLSILATVKNCIEDWIDKNNPQCLTIFSSDKHGDLTIDRQKDKVYQLMWKRHPKRGYGISDISVFGKTGFCIYNINRVKKK